MANHAAPVQRNGEEEERALLPNVNFQSRQYRSQARDFGDERRQYRMDASPRDDAPLRRHIGRAQAFAGAGGDVAERSALLFHYASSRLPVNDDRRDAQYRHTTTEQQTHIHRATMGQCLDNGVACREQAGLLHLLLANEGVPNTMRVGRSNNPRLPDSVDGERHAWVELGDQGDMDASENILDPRAGHFQSGGAGYHPAQNVQLALPLHTDPATTGGNRDQFHENVRDTAYALDREHRFRQAHWRPTQALMRRFGYGPQDESQRRAERRFQQNHWGITRFFMRLFGYGPNANRARQLYDQGQQRLEQHDRGPQQPGIRPGNRERDVELQPLTATHSQSVGNVGDSSSAAWDPFGDDLGSGVDHKHDDDFV